MTLDKRVAIVGLGYVGLPLAEAFVNAGCDVVGYDVDRVKVEMLESGKCPLKHFGDERLRRMIDTRRFYATTTPADLAMADAILICVPTPLADGEPDLSFIQAAALTVGRHLRRGQLVVLESSTYPGTTRDVLRVILEGFGPVAGTDFLLAYSPEREDPGNTAHPLTSIPKVIGGFDEASLAAAQELYQLAFAQTVPVASLEVAEACKLLENTYRLVNIALVNELKAALGTLNVDIWDVIAAAKTKPFGFQAFYPGPGAGGHCIPVDPVYLTWAAGRASRPVRCPLVERAVAANHNEHSRAIIAVGHHAIGMKVCVLGLAYKADIDDLRESPGWAIFDCLRRGRYEVTYADPHLPAVAGCHSQTLTPEFVAAQDAIVIATAHRAFDYDLLAQHARLIIDTRNAMAGRACKGKVVKA